MALRTALPVATAALLLSACGSGTTTAPVESSAASGDVAAASVCFEGPPAKDGLIDMARMSEDGVVGAIYNQSGETIWVRAFGQKSDAPHLAPQDGSASEPAALGGNEQFERWMCRLDSGKRAAFAFPEGVQLLLSTTSSMNGGTAVLLEDPYIGWPKATASGFRRANDALRADTCGPSGYKRLSEGDTFYARASDGSGSMGDVSVVRLEDDEAAANTWTGQTTQTDDWARLDVNVNRIGGCS